MITNFIGRETELDRFKNILDHFTPGKPYIVYLHDAATQRDEKGGVGKTWLLQKFMEMVKSEYADKFLLIDQLIDFYQTQNHNRIQIMHSLMQTLQKQLPGDYFTEFQGAYQKFMEVTREKTDEIRLRLAYEELFTSYIKTYRDIAQGEKKIIIRFYDTLDAFEAFERALMTGQKQFPMTELQPYSLAVIASRNAIDWDNPNWSGREDSIQVFSLQGFDFRETSAYFQAYCKMEVDENQVKIIHHKTKGRPILVGLAVDLINHRVKNIEHLITVSEKDFLKTLVSYVNEFARPRDVAITLMAHVYHHFDKKILEYLMQADFSKYDFELLAEELPKLSFVKASGNQFILQDEMRRLINLYVWDPQDPDRKLRKEISQKMVTYYDQKLKDTADENYQQILLAEQLYHKLYSDLEAKWNEFYTKLNASLEDYALGFARLLLKSVEDLKPILPPAEKALFQVYEGWYELYSGNYENARTLVNQGKAELEKIAVYDNLDDILNTLGYIYRLEGDWQNAITNFQAALKYSRQFNHRKLEARILNNLGLVYRFIADPRKSLMYSEESLSIREELGDERAIALTNIVLGKSLWESRNVNEAGRQFQRAYRIYTKLNDEIGLANVKANLAYIDYRLEKLDSALKQIDEALAVYETKGMMGEYAVNLLLKGRIMRGSDRLDEAEKILLQALNLLQKGPNQYALCDGYLNLTILYYKKQDFQQAGDYYNLGFEIAKKHQYHLLWTILERYAGNILYDQHQYEKTFEKYFISAKIATKCRESELSQILMELRIRLNKLPEQPLIIHYCDYIIDKWQRARLAKKYPQVIETCQGIKELKYAQ